MMQIYDTIRGLKKVVFALGVFDGVHLGHQAVIAALRAAAEKYDAEPVAMYFSPFPVNVLKGENSVPALTTDAQKMDILTSCGVRHIVRCPFTLELAVVSPEDFVRDYFVGQPFEVKAICVGENWRFGRENSGDAQTLRRIAAEYGIEVVTVPAKAWQDERISSTRIRRLIAEGNMADAKAMMGRNFAVTGTVAHGSKVAGSILHFPTINLAESCQVIPKFGVYSTKVKFPEKSGSYPAIAYVGDAPTFRNDGKVIFELHVLNFNDDVYGNSISAEFVEFIRPSMKFESPQALQEQIRRDIAIAMK